MTMTPDEFRNIRTEVLKMTQGELATYLGYGASQRISEMEGNREGIPTHLQKLMRAYQEGYRPKDKFKPGPRIGQS